VLIQGAILQIQCSFDKGYKASKFSQLLIFITSSKAIIIMFTEKRNISVRELGVGDREGWLLHRCRSGGAGAVWLRAWFVLKGTIFYGFKTPQSVKADTMISLPGFTASLADEVKSRRYAFKVYHTGKIEKQGHIIEVNIMLTHSLLIATTFSLCTEVHCTFIAFFMFIFNP